MDRGIVWSFGHQNFRHFSLSMLAQLICMAATQSFKSHSETLLPPSIKTMKHTLEVEAFDDETIDGTDEE